MRMEVLDETAHVVANDRKNSIAEEQERTREAEQVIFKELEEQECAFKQRLTRRNTLRQSHGVLPTLRDVDLSFDSPVNLTTRGQQEGFTFPIAEIEEERGATPCRTNLRE